MEISIGKNIRKLRKASDVSQEVLAEAVGVTVQAVSKWENEISLPDIAIVPEISAFFGVSLDELFFGDCDVVKRADGFPNDGKLYVVWSQNGEILGQKEWQKDKHIYIELPGDVHIEAEIWGSVEIKGDVNGNISANGGINCQNVTSGISANGSVNCGNVVGGVHAEGSVNCGNVVGGVHAEDSVNCGNIDGGANCSGNIRCGNIDCGDISCETLYANCDNIDCGDISCETLYSKGKVRCREINGEIHIEESISFD